MAEVTRSLRFVAVSDGFEVGRLDLLDDGTVRSARENDSQAGSSRRTATSTA